MAAANYYFRILSMILIDFQVDSKQEEKSWFGYADILHLVMGPGLYFLYKSVLGPRVCSKIEPRAHRPVYFSQTA